MVKNFALKANGGRKEVRPISTNYRTNEEEEGESTFIEPSNQNSIALNQSKKKELQIDTHTSAAVLFTLGRDNNNADPHDVRDDSDVSDAEDQFAAMQGECNEEILNSSQVSVESSDRKSLNTSHITRNSHNYRFNSTKLGVMSGQTQDPETFRNEDEEVTGTESNIEKLEIVSIRHSDIVAPSQEPQFMLGF